MSMIDWEGKVGGPTVAIFANAVGLYQPASGATPYLVRGVFDQQFRSTNVIDTLVPNISDSLPVFGVNRAQFQAEPAQSDRVTFRPEDQQFQNQIFSGKSYLVREPRPDSHGVYHLALNEAA